MSDYDVDTTKYIYIEPIWEILANHPEGITLDELVKISKLDKNSMLRDIEKISFEYNQLTRKKFTKGSITSMIGRAFKGEKVKEEIEDDLTKSWIFDKVMLYARVKELDWTKDVMFPDEINEMKKKWLESRGM